MTQPEDYTTRLQQLLDRWNAGDKSAIDEIISHSQEWLRRMASKMLATKPHVGRWNQTGDLLQNALLRLHRALKDVSPESTRDFYGLAALQIRRELIDMARSLYGPEGLARHHQSDPGQADDDGAARPLYEKIDPATDVANQSEMTNFLKALAASLRKNAKCSN